MNEPADNGIEILVADDRKELRWLYQHWLEAGGYRVRIANDGVELDRQLREKAPDLILLDLHLHGLEGLQICRRLKDSPLFQRIPIIATTHEARSLAVRLAKTSGADGILGKPFSRIELELEVERQVVPVENGRVSLAERLATRS